MTSIIKALLTIFTLALSLSPALAQDPEEYSDLGLCRPLDQQYYRDRERGWYFKEYCQPLPKEEKKENEAKKEPALKEPPPIDWAQVQDPKYLDTLDSKQFRELINRVQDDVVYNPTHEKLIAYLTMQDYMKNKSMKFAYVWQDVLLDHPELNPTVQNPTSSYGVHVKGRQDELQNMATLAKMSEDTGIFFFVSGDCPYCHAEADVLINFTKRYGVEIRTISNDHCGYDNFQNCSIAPQLFEVFDVKVTPTLVAVYKGPDDKPRYQPIASGIVTLEEIIRRLVFYYKYNTTGEYPG
jgi:conjugal transfer pilus assembly protein TraF